jgi:uncharacterized phage protein (TIGR02220 family)
VIIEVARYRQVYTEFWQDTFVIDLTPEEKFFYLYLLTNSKTTQCGIYEIPIKVMILETGYNRETILRLIERFESYEKIKYNSETKEMVVMNWLKYNSINSPKVQKCIENELKQVKSRGLIPYLYGIDTLCIDWGEEENRIEENRTEENRIEKNTMSSTYRPIIDYLNEKCGTHYRPSTKKTKSLIDARTNEGFEIEDFKTVIDKKSDEWIGTKYEKYLRPQTLFGTKFEGYLNQKTSSKNSNAFLDMLDDEGDFDE